MNWIKWIIVVIALSEAGWMTFDGARALIKGDYVTPKSGEYAGQLGPWAKIVSAAGIEPRSTLMKTIFVVYGVVWLSMIVCFILQLPFAWWGMMILSLSSLWYLTIGTAHSVLQLILLMLPAARNMPK